MSVDAEITWLTLIGLSLLFVGGFVLWVYGSEAPQRLAPAMGPEAEATKNLHTHFVQWFLLYGAAAAFAGAGCLLTAAMLVL